MAFVMMPEQNAAVTPLSPQPHLLVIDDDTNNRELMHRLFSSMCRVTLAANGRQGLEVIATEEVDVVLLDIMMPGITGFTVLERLRANPATADLPVILVSGLTDSNHVVRGLELGANDYVTKPINLHVAQARVVTQLKLKRLLDEQKRIIAKLEQLNQLREHFFRIASHDLKNPLTNLNLAFSELSMFVPQAEETDDLQNNIATTLEQMQTLIEDFLDMTVLENNTLEFVPSSFDVYDCLQQVASQFARAAARKNIALVVAETHKTIVADKNRLMQAIGNLVSNAIKFSPSGTTVSLWTQSSDDRLRIYVQDEGPGIPLEEQARLFTEFVKGSSQPTGGETSTGLGLWIVSKLAQMLNGFVGVESTPGQGATFWIELPIYREPL